MLLTQPANSGVIPKNPRRLLFINEPKQYKNMNFFMCRNACTSRHWQQQRYFQVSQVQAKHRLLKQIIMRIHLTAFFIGLAFFNVAANNVTGQNVTIKVSNAELRSVFTEIKKQTGYLFWYEDNLLTNRKKVSLNLKDVTLEEALDASLKNQPLTYSINDKTIVVKVREKGILDRIAELLKAINVTGKVSDENGLPLVGATVSVKGTNNQTTTNSSGIFSLQNVSEDAIIEISYIGYVTQQVRAEALLTVYMRLSQNEIQEVRVNAGYYTVTEAERTGSIARVDAKTISQQPVSNPLAAMIGRMSGVNIEQQSGINGGGFKIEIRGQNSLRSSATDNGNRPLYLINGVPYPSTTLSSSVLGIGGIAFVGSPLNSINPNDIESIEILKDADATAIYGSRGANGVVLITTKKAKAGRSKYELSVQQGASVISARLNLLNTEQYLAMRNEAFKNDGLTPGATQYDLNGTWDKDRYTDWQKALIGGTAKSTNASGSINGGSELTQFSFTGNYSRQTTVLPADFANEKAAGSLSINHTSENKKFKANVSTLYALDLNKLPTFDFTMFIFLPPNAPALYDANGNLNWALNSSGASTWANPVSSSKQPYTGRSGSFISSAQLGYELIPGLSLLSNFGYTAIGFKETTFQPISSYAPSPTATGLNRFISNGIETWNLEPQLNYKHTLLKGNVDVLVGTTFQSTSQKTETIAGNGYTSDLLIENINAAPTRIALNTSSLYKYAAVFGRINYNYNGTYILNFTGRRDGSSRFGPDKKFSNFGALGAAWVFSNNTFIQQKLSFLSFGKLRGSYGITGSDQIPDYGYLETYSATNPYIDGSGLFPGQLANPDFSWETNKKLEAAIDLGFLQDRILLAASWYRNRSSNQLVGYKLPDITGFSSIQYNLPATVENTGWEFELNTSNIQGKSFTWSSALNLTIPRNELLAYPGIEGSSYANTYTVGESLYKPRRYNYLGLDPSTGVYKFEDLNGNGVLDAGDRQPTERAYTSHWYGGVQNTLSYKSLSLDIFIQAVSKTVQSPFVSALPGSMNNQTVDVLNRWQQPGDQTPFTKFTQSTASGSAGASFNQLTNSDRDADASFVRLKNVSLSYTFPQALIDKVKLQNMRLFVQGQNLWTITKYPGDPEVVNLRFMPSLRTVTAGLSVGL